MSMQTRNFDSENLDRFGQYQRRSFATLIAVGRTLKVGKSETEVARRIRRAFHQQGVHHYFFEEILVIDDQGARWLDDDLPHSRFWAGEPMLGWYDGVCTQ